MRLIECVPNFSEGRDSANVDAIVATMLAVPGVYLLAREMDADHHRSVITLAGEPTAVAEAAVRGVGEAARRIDLRQHRGAHPRIGATDVVPFIPLEGATLEECVRLAEWAGEEIWKRFRIPVYLYEAAARVPDRRNLENIRKGQFEGLLEAVKCDPERRPDFGGNELHASAGATVVGARKFLIAYNINLDTADVEIAKKIAKTIRASSGGLPCVKGMGVMLAAKNRAQVSMNLTDFETTSLTTVWEAVAAEAARYGARPVESELIGLAPRKALEAAAAGMLHFDVFEPEMVIENRVAAVMGALPVRLEAHLRPFVEELASDSPAPGGGSAAAAAGAMAAGLGQMVARLALGKAAKAASPDASVTTRLEAMREEFSSLQDKLLRAVDLDSESFLAIRAARRSPKQTPAEQEVRQRARAIEAATIHATEVPLATAMMSRRVRELVHDLQGLAPAAMASDLSTAIALADAAFAGAGDNVRINLDSMPEALPDRRRLSEEFERLRQV